MFSQPHPCLLVAVWVLLTLGSWPCFAAEGKIRTPYTEPVIQSSHGDALHPESGASVSVLPVIFNVTVAEPFVKSAGLVNGTQSTGKAIAPQHIFLNATLRLVFDVPNPGLDFVILLTSVKYPLIQDSNGTLWRSVLPLRIEVVKQNTKYTYDVGNLSLRSYQSKSESVEVVAGVPQTDADCSLSNGCCAVNSSHYRKYSLVDSPVPPYVCTGSPIPYSLRHFTFMVDSTIKFWSAAEVASCQLRVNQSSKEVVDCTGNSSVAMRGIATKPSFILPSDSYSLCRQGGDLVNPQLDSPPISVNSLSFCPGSRCIGYTPANHRRDRGTCVDYPLGFYTSLDGNNTNQFSSFEKSAAALWPLYFSGCRWIDDVTMSSPTSIEGMSFQCDVPRSTGWSLSYAGFSAPLTDTVEPLFPIGRPTRVSGQYVDSADEDTILFELEYVSFSSYKGARWTMRVCSRGRCVKSASLAAGDRGYYPQVMRVNVSAAALHLATSPDSTAVTVDVYSASTPITSPFRSLLAPSLVYVEKIRSSSQDTVDMTLARDPPERLPSPYAASTSGKTTSRVLCEGDYRFSTVTNDCQPLTDKDCAIKYRGRRSKLDIAIEACTYPVPLLDDPLVFKPLAEPVPPRLYSPEELRTILTKVKLPQFLRSMEKTYSEHERLVAKQTNQPETVEPGPAATGKDSGAIDDKGHRRHRERRLTIFCIAMTCLLWTVALLRDVLCRLLGLGPWRGEPLCAVTASLRRCWGWVREAWAEGQTGGGLHQPGTARSFIPMATAGQPAAAAPWDSGEPISTPQQEAQRRGQRRAAFYPRTHFHGDAHQGFRQNAASGATPTAFPRSDAPSYCTASPPSFQHSSGFTAAPHAPFGNEARYPAAGGNRAHPCGGHPGPEGGFSRVPTAGAEPHPASSQRRWEHFPSSSGTASFPQSTGGSPCKAARPPPYRSRGGAPPPPPSCGGADAFSPNPPVRQSSRVEVISDVDELHGNAGAARAAHHAGRAHRLDSID